MADSLYLETSVISYLAADLSRDVIVVAHQQVTHEWWKTARSKYDIRVSELVIGEASRGDPEAAQKRLSLMQEFPVLTITEEARRLAAVYLQEIPFLIAAERDALHLAIASAAGIDYLATWNCTHIARGQVKKAVERVNDEQEVGTPTICTPEELLGVYRDVDRPDC